MGLWERGVKRRNKDPRIALQWWKVEQDVGPPEEPAPCHQLRERKDSTCGPQLQTILRWFGDAADAVSGVSFPPPFYFLGI